jgi:hypothetical protein
MASCCPTTSSNSVVTAFSTCSSKIRLDSEADQHCLYNCRYTTTTAIRCSYCSIHMHIHKHSRQTQNATLYSIPVLRMQCIQHISPFTYARYTALCVNMCTLYYTCMRVRTDTALGCCSVSGLTAAPHCCSSTAKASISRSARPNGLVSTGVDAPPVQFSVQYTILTTVSLCIHSALCMLLRYTVLRLLTIQGCLCSQSISIYVDNAVERYERRRVSSTSESSLQTAYRHTVQSTQVIYGVRPLGYRWTQSDLRQSTTSSVCIPAVAVVSAARPSDALRPP